MKKKNTLYVKERKNEGSNDIIHQAHLTSFHEMKVRKEKKNGIRIYSEKELEDTDKHRFIDR